MRYIIQMSKLEKSTKKSFFSYSIDGLQKKFRRHLDNIAQQVRNLLQPQQFLTLFIFKDHLVLFLCKVYLF